MGFDDIEEFDEQIWGLEESLEKENMRRIAAEHLIACMLYQLGGEYVVTDLTMMEIPYNFSLATYQDQGRGVRLKLLLNGEE